MAQCWTIMLSTICFLIILIICTWTCTASWRHNINTVSLSRSTGLSIILQRLALKLSILIYVPSLAFQPRDQSFGAFLLHSLLLGTNTVFITYAWQGSRQDTMVLKCSGYNGFEGSDTKPKAIFRASVLLSRSFCWIITSKLAPAVGIFHLVGLFSILEKGRK